MLIDFQEYDAKDDFNSSLESGEVTVSTLAFIKDTREIYLRGTYYKGDDNFQQFWTGYNSVTSLSNLPITKRLIKGTINGTPGELSFLSPPNVGDEFKLIMTTTSSLLLELPNNDSFMPIGRTTADLSEGSVFILEITCYDEGKYNYYLTVQDGSSSLYYQDYPFLTLSVGDKTEKKVSELFEVSSTDTLELLMMTIGAGGQGGSPGNGWGLYKGGTGAAGTNGGIAVIRIPVHYNDIVTVQRLSDSYQVICNGCTIRSFNGTNGGDGSNATAGGRGDGGTGGQGTPNSLTLNSNITVNTLLDYYDPQAPNGISGGAGDTDNDVQPNPLPENIQYSSYAKGGYGMAVYSESNVPGAGGIILRCYYTS